jgi:hypothetical protein
MIDVDECGKSSLADARHHGGQDVYKDPVSRNPAACGGIRVGAYQ